MKKVIISLICVIAFSLVSVESVSAAGKPSINKFKKSLSKGKVQEALNCTYVAVSCGGNKYYHTVICGAKDLNELVELSQAFAEKLCGM